MWHDITHADLEAWSRFAGNQIVPKAHTKRQDPVWDGEASIPLAHGSFDNDIKVITNSIKRIRDFGRPRRRKLKLKVENLHGF